MRFRLLSLTSFVLAVAGAAQAAVVTPVLSGVSGAIGQAVDPVTQQIYWVEFNTGIMHRLDPFSLTDTPIANGFTNPEDLALYPGQPLAYVTTRDGKLWKVATNSNTKSLVTSGLGAPHQIVLDPANFVAYTVDFSGGNLYRVALGGGSTTPLVTGLSNPIGLLMSPDFKTAYVAEPNRILEIQLPSLATNVVVSGLTSSFFMDWADDSHSAIYVAERDPANRVTRVDLSVSPSTTSLIAAVPLRPSSVVRSGDPNVVYVASDSVISKVELASPGGPVITRIGHIPSTSINWTDGLATTVPSYFFYVKNASFGGSVHVMLNFPNMRALGAKYYRVYAGGTLQLETWTNYKWNGTTFAPQTVAPVFSGLYAVPTATELWATPDLGFILDTTKLPNDREVVVVALYDASFSFLSSSIGYVALRIDNNGPAMDIEEVWHDGAKLDECALIVSGTPNLTFVFTAKDNEAHLFNYSLVDRWGSGASAPVTSDHYIGVHDSLTTWAGVSHGSVAYTLSNTACSHSFLLDGWSNTTNGFNRIHYRSDLEHIAIYLGGPTCRVQ
jgi:sugar lactone lactonase YvrE